MKLLAGDDSVVERLESLPLGSRATFAEAMDQRRGTMQTTALMEAVLSNNESVTAWLLEAGVTVTPVDKLDRSAFDIARAMGRPHLLALLGRGAADVVTRYRTVKVMLLGDSMAGKSSLVKALSHDAVSGSIVFKPGWAEFLSPLSGTALDCRTVGIDVSNVRIRPLAPVSSSSDQTNL